MADLKQIAQGAALRAFKAAEAVLIDVMVRFGPTVSTYDPATDKTTLSWAHNETAQALPYADQSFRKRVEDPETKVRSYVLLGSEITVTPTQAGEVVEPGGVTWQIREAIRDPADAVVILHCTA